LDLIIERIETAKKDNVELDRLISDYMPFIIKTVNDADNFGIDYDDRMSLALLSFMNCVKQYEPGKGNFVAFTAVCIRNRLIDEGRRQKKNSGKVIPLFSGEDDRTSETVEDRASIAAYNQEREQESLSGEIDAFSTQLYEFGISLTELPRICPKQERSRKQCIELGRFVSSDEGMRGTLLKYRRLSQSELARQFGVSEKTIEKHRKYIVTIVILLLGDYPLIRSFLPQYKEL
jgi:RNA polymerase sigma factor